MTQHELNAIITSGEGYKTEFKQSAGSDLAKEMVAFANAGGGRIFIGVADNGTVPGITITNKIRSELESIAQSCDPAVDISLEEFDNKVIIIHVPEGKKKPYRSTGGFYLRSGASSIKMSTQEIIAFVKSEGRVRFDELESRDVKYPDERNDVAVDRFKRLARIDNTLSADDLLTNLNVLYRQDKPVLNNAGVLFFVKNPALYIPHNSVICVLYKGNGKVNIIDKKAFDLDIITNIDDALDFLKKHLNLAYVIKEKRRREDLEIPEVVLREAIVNAVAHRDYFEKGAVVMVEVFDNRVEISNPGGLPKGLSEADFGTRTLARNPLIASLLNRAGYIEKLGTGVPRIRKTMEDAALPEPVFRFDHFFTVILRRYNPVSELRKDLDIPEAKARRIAFILEKLVQGTKLEPERIAAELDATARTVRNDIYTLEEAKWVTAKGATHTREYNLTATGREKAGKYF